MGAGLKKNGTRAIAAVTIVCAALSPAALAAVGGVQAERHDATASRLVRPAVPYRDGRKPSPLCGASAVGHDEGRADREEAERPTAQ